MIRIRMVSCVCQQSGTRPSKAKKKRKRRNSARLPPSLQELKIIKCPGKRRRWRTHTNTHIQTQQRRVHGSGPFGSGSSALIIVPIIIIAHRQRAAEFKYQQSSVDLTHSCCCVVSSTLCHPRILSGGCRRQSSSCLPSLLGSLRRATCCGLLSLLESLLLLRLSGGPCRLGRLSLH